jgi:tetratricopeptide (TPR) repeat protein
MKRIIALLVLCMCLLGFATTSIAAPSNIKGPLKEQVVNGNNTTATSGINGTTRRIGYHKPTPEVCAQLLQAKERFLASLNDPKCEQPKYAIYFDIATIDMQLCDYSEAIVYADKALKLRPNEVTIRFLKLAALDYELPDSERKNIRLLQEADSLVKYSPNNVILRFLRLDYNKKLKHYDAVLVDTTALLSLINGIDNEAEATAYFEQGNAHLHLHKYIAAKNDFTNSAALTYNKLMKAVCKNNLALAYKGMGRYKQALNTINESIKIGEKLVYALDTKGDILVSMKRYNDGLSYLNKAIELYEPNGDTYYNRGRAYEGLKDIPKAIADYEKAVELKAEEHTKDASARLAVLKK